MWKTDHIQVLVGELTPAADPPEGQQGAHDLDELLADHVGPMCAEHVILGSGPFEDMQVQLLLCLAEGDCKTAQQHVSQDSQMQTGMQTLAPLSFLMQDTSRAGAHMRMRMHTIKGLIGAHAGVLTTDGAYRCRSR